MTYTTRYRDDNLVFKRCAETKANELRNAGFAVRCVPTETKQDFSGALVSSRLDELHFFGHSGLYGIMFGTIKRPEQFSPHEWRSMKSPFASNAKAYFHACRTGRWFAPFIARTFNIKASGYQLYTTFSSRPDAFRLSVSRSSPLYMLSIPGRKSHGLMGSVGKYTGLSRPVPMDQYEPKKIGDRDQYNYVAELYDEAYKDIRVRQDEWNWLEDRIPTNATVCDIGCGTGALMRALRNRIKSGVGLDESQQMLNQARKRSTGDTRLSFEQITGPELPLSNKSTDFVTSLLSFRYLDWDPITEEIERVLKPGGRLLIVDMVASPATARDMPRALFDKARVRAHHFRFPHFKRSLDKLVESKEWGEMLKYNPIRAEHEYRWYLSSRFPKGKFSVLNVGLRSKILAFDSGPIETATLKPIQYP